MSRVTPLLKRTALPENVKVNTVANETIRRMKNTSRDLNPTVVEGVLSDYMSDLQRGGFDKAWIVNAVGAGVKGYTKMAKNEINGGGPINRSEKSTKAKRRFKKVMWQRDVV